MDPMMLIPISHRNTDTRRPVIFWTKRPGRYTAQPAANTQHLPPSTEREAESQTISKRALPSVLITAEARATCRNRKPVDHARGAVRWIRQQRAPAPAPARSPVPEPPLLLPLRSPLPSLLSSTPPSLARPLVRSSLPRSSWHPRKECPFRSVPCFFSSSPPHPVLVRSLPLYFPVSLGSFAALDLGCLVRFVGTFFNLCWDSIDALFGCFSVEHFVEHRGGGPSMVQKSK